MRPSSALCAASALVLAFGMGAAFAAAPSELLITKRGERRLGSITSDGDMVTVATSYGEIQVPLDEVAEIIGANAALVKTEREVRLKHRSPDVFKLVERGIGARLSGDPEGLEEIVADEVFSIWMVPSKTAKKEARELLDHTRGIVNRMKAFFPKAKKPSQPCRIRFFETDKAFLAWRDRAADVTRAEVLVEALREFYLSDDAVMIADLRAAGPPVSTQISAYRDHTNSFLEQGASLEQLIAAQLMLSLLGNTCAGGKAREIKVLLDAYLDTDLDELLETKAAPPPELPSADPTEEGEATFINYGYFMAASNELVLWRSDEMWRTLSHETFHYFLEHNCPQAPIWVNEGFATYFETFRPRQRAEHQGFHFGRFDEFQSAPERGVPFVPLEQLFVLPTPVWQAQEGPLQSFLYAESWAVIHFMLEGEELDFGDKGEKLLKGYLGSLAAGKSPAEAMKEHFTGEVAPDKLEEKVLYHMARLQRPAAEPDK